MLSLLLTFIIPMDLLRNRFGAKVLLPVISYVQKHKSKLDKIQQALYWSILNIVAFALDEYKNPG